MSCRLGVIVTILTVSLCFPEVERSLALTEVSGSDASVSIETKSRLVNDYGAQPLHFERHEVQAGTNATYIAHGQGYALLLSSDELTLALKQARRAPSIGTPGSRYADNAPTPGDTVRVRLSGADPKARITGLDPLPGRSNYFVGNDPTKWRTDVPHYAKVKLESAYPGIDLVFYGNGRQIEYDFVVAPGADPRQIRLAIEGVEKPALKPSGDLGLPLPHGELIFHAPHVYQVVDGIQHGVSARFVVADNGQVGFEVGNYDIARALVIDPVLSYSTYLGGSAPYFDNGDWGNAIAIDAAGNAYVAGYAASTDFPTTAGAFDRSGGYAGFVAKFGPTGTLIYSTYLGGSAWMTAAWGIAVDAAGNAYVVGETTNTDFPTTAGALQRACAVGAAGGCSDAFVVKLNPTGSALLYSTYLGGPGDGTHFGDDHGRAIALDSAGNVYVTGRTRSNSFPVTASAFQRTYAGGAGDVFVAKLNAAGSALVYATYLGGTGGTLWGDEPYAITVDSHGHAYVTGYTTSFDFPTTAGAFQPASAGDTDVFITKLSADGSALVYSTYVGGTWHDYGGRGIAVDAEGNAYVTGGQIWSSDFPTTPGSYQPRCAGTSCADAFVLKLNPAGSALVWSTYLGGSAGEQGSAIAVDAKGHVYVTGNTDSADFPTRFSLQAYGGPGTFPWGDAFVTKLSADGSRLLYSTYLGGTGDDAGLGIAVDAARNVYVTGGTSSSDFPTAAAAQSSNHGYIDAFVAKLAAITYNLTVTNPVTGAGTVSSSPTGITCGSTCSAAFDQGERVTLTATVAAGSTFTGWSGACTGTGACVVEMDQARSVTATFRPAPPTITVLAASPASPQPVGTTLTLTASVTGTAPQCKWLVTTDPSWATYNVLRTWQACATPVPWTPTVAGSYQLGLWARSNGNTTDAPEGGAAAAFGYTITPPVPPRITSLTANLISPQPVGTTLTLSATVTGGTAPQQCKWLVTTDPTWATYNVLRTWGACTTLATWTPTAPGSYQLGVWARSNGNTTDAPEGGAAAAFAYTITPMTVRVTATPPSPQLVGTPVSLTATVTGGTAPQQCKWLVTTDPTWATYDVLRTWGACTTPVTYTLTVAGTYQFGVWARSSGNTTDAPESGAAAALPYISLGSAPPPTIVATPASSQVVGTPISLAATVAALGTAPQCKWLLTTDPSWATYNVLRTWGACTTPASWTPTVAGTYQLGLWARSNGNTTDAPEGGAAAAFSYTVTPMRVTVAATPPTPRPVGTLLTFTASVTGGTAPQQCKWLVAMDPSWGTYTTLRDWQPCTTPATWTPTAPWPYQVGVWARSSGNTTDAPEGGAAAALAYTVTPMTVTATATPAAPQVTGTALTFSATVIGGPATAPQQCKWLVTTDSWTTYTTLRDWAACTTPATWTPTARWPYQVGVWVRSAGNTTDYPEASAAVPYEVLFNLAGSWYYSESGTVTYTIAYAGETETDTQSVSQSGTVSVVQNGTEICLTPPGAGTSFRRCGALRGNVVELSGIGCAPLPGLAMTFTENVATARGTVSADGRTMWLTGSTSCQGTGTYEGIPFTFRASGWSTVTMTR